MSLNLFLLILKISDFVSSEKKRPMSEILGEMVKEKREREGIEKTYCEVCGKFRGYDKECRGGKYPTPEIKECKKHE